MARPRTFNENEVLDRARDLFWKKGFADTSIQDLEKATGLKRTSLYAAFGSKQQLYLKTLAHYQNEAHRTVVEQFGQEVDSLESIRCLLYNSIHRALDDRERKGCFLSNAAAERGGNCPETTQYLHQNRTQLTQLFQQQLIRAKSQNKITGDPKALAIYLFTLYSGLMNTIRTGVDRPTVLSALDTGLSVIR